VSSARLHRYHVVFCGVCRDSAIEVVAPARPSVPSARRGARTNRGDGGFVDVLLDFLCELAKHRDHIAPFIGESGLCTGFAQCFGNDGGLLNDCVERPERWVIASSVPLNGRGRSARSCPCTGQRAPNFRGLTRRPACREMGARGRIHLRPTPAPRHVTRSDGEPFSVRPARLAVCRDAGLGPGYSIARMPCAFGAYPTGNPLCRRFHHGRNNFTPVPRPPRGHAGHRGESGSSALAFGSTSQSEYIEHGRVALLLEFR
jgi:hypothetical protein